jgi:hypothetical protein
MPLDLAQSFRQRITAAEALLAAVDEATAATPARATGGWLRKEELGHLIDSSVNNHSRFAHAAIGGIYTGPAYAQNEWVALHGYAELPWSELLTQWRLRNELLARLVERIPAEKLDVHCIVGDGAPVTLEFLITDYLGHLEGHVRVITGRSQTAHG